MYCVTTPMELLLSNQMAWRELNKKNKNAHWTHQGQSCWRSTSDRVDDCGLCLSGEKKSQSTTKKTKPRYLKGRWKAWNPFLLEYIICSPDFRSERNHSRLVTSLWYFLYEDCSSCQDNTARKKTILHSFTASPCIWRTSPTAVNGSEWVLRIKYLIHCSHLIRVRDHFPEFWWVGRKSTIGRSLIIKQIFTDFNSLRRGLKKSATVLFCCEMTNK